VFPLFGTKSGMAHFCRHSTNFIEHYACRAAPRASEASNGGTSLIETANLSLVTKFGAGTGAIAVQTVSEPENCHGTGFKLRADERVRVQEPLQSCLRSRSKSKKCDKLIDPTVRVGGSYFYKVKSSNRLFIILSLGISL
jgi:hypothetical protein